MSFEIGTECCDTGVTVMKDGETICLKCKQSIGYLHIGVLRKISWLLRGLYPQDKPIDTTEAEEWFKYDSSPMSQGVIDMAKSDAVGLLAAIDFAIRSLGIDRVKQDDPLFLGVIGRIIEASVLHHLSYSSTDGSQKRVPSGVRPPKYNGEIGLQHLVAQTRDSPSL